MSSPPAAAPEEPAEEPSSPVTAQIAPEPLLPVRISAAIIPVPEFSKVSVAPAAHPAQEATFVVPVQVFPISSGDTELTEAREVSASVPVTSALQLEQTASSAAASQPLNPVVSSVLPVQPEVH